MEDALRLSIVRNLFQVYIMTSQWGTTDAWSRAMEVPDSFTHKCIVLDIDTNKGNFLE